MLTDVGISYPALSDISRQLATTGEAMAETPTVLTAVQEQVNTGAGQFAGDLAGGLDGFTRSWQTELKAFGEAAVLLSASVTNCAQSWQQLDVCLAPTPGPTPAAVPGPAPTPTATPTAVPGPAPTPTPTP